MQYTSGAVTLGLLLDELDSLRHQVSEDTLILS
jgi:hypothetical protein